MDTASSAYFTPRGITVFVLHIKVRVSKVNGLRGAILARSSFLGGLVALH
jgi:hypothetical protein